MSIWRSSMLALTVATGMAVGASAAVADGPPPGPGPGRGAEWPNIPWGSWTGLYGGVHVGSIDAWWDDGLVGGVQLGKNWQSGKLVYGIEGDVSLSDADGVNWTATVRGRLGYLLSPGILLYGSAGLGLVDFESRRGGGDTESDFVYGLGIEGKVTETTTVRLEYLGFSDSDVDIVRVGANWKLNW